MADHTPYQKKIIQRYYENREVIGYHQLSELVGEIYLAEGKKLDTLWKRVAAALAKLEIPPQRAEHLIAKRDPKLLADLVRELTGK